MMWNRKDLKAKGKAAFAANRGICILAILVLLAVGGLSGLAMLIPFVGSLAATLLLLNPMEVGLKSFFLHNAEAPANLDELGAGFRDWGRIVVAMLFRNLFLGLWSMLFIIPGIVKSYSYRLVPYLLADNPELKGTEAITLSRQMMNGHKWNTFVLDLSFIGWGLLGTLTFGILNIVYVLPYMAATDAELYRALRDGTSKDTMWA